MRNMRKGRKEGMKEEGEEKEKIKGAKLKQGQDESGAKKGGGVGRKRERRGEEEMGKNRENLGIREREEKG